MTFAGNKLQNVYDSGSDKLVELESNIVDKLKQAKRSHAQTLSKNVQDQTGRIQDTASTLQYELEKYIDGYNDKLNNLIEAEIKETQTFAKHILTEFSGLSEKLKMTVANLKRSHEENLEHVSASSFDKYLNSVELARIELEKHRYGASKHLKVTGTFVTNSLQQRLDHVLWETRGDEKQMTGLLFKSYMQKANAIDNHFSTLMQGLSSDFQTQQKKLEDAAKTSEDQLFEKAKVILEKVEDEAATAEHDLKQLFGTATEAHKKKQESTLTIVADELSAVHDSTATTLNKYREELTDGLTNTSVQVRNALENRCQVVTKQIETAVEALNVRLADQVTSSLALKQGLENDQEEIVRLILRDLNQILETFEKKVATLMSDSGQRINKLLSGAEQDIGNAHERCTDKLTKDAQNIEQQITGEITGFLERLAQHRTAALKEIETSASDHSSVPQEKVTEKPETESGKIAFEGEN
jgi:hypothetical protein